MKFSKKDCIRLLFGFGEITDEVIDDGLLQHILVKNPLKTTTLLSFSFGKQDYYTLFDADLSDDLASARNQIRKIFPNADPELVPGKNDLGGFFRGKIVYLFRERVSKKRLDILATERFPDLTRSQIVKLIKNGEVNVDGQAVRVAKTLVSTDAEIAVNSSQPITDLPDIPVLFENKNVVVINKPAGILSHPKDGPNSGQTLVDFLEQRIGPDLLASEFKTNRTGIVHRLDRGTSGVMIMAKTPEAASYLARQFAERKAKKTYLAVVHGQPKLPKAVIDVPIARSIKSPTTFLANANGKPAQTVYETLDSNGNFSLLCLKPKTGRTHQIRVHLVYVNTPIVGDFIYNKKQIRERPFLHALELEITVPSDDGKNVRQTFHAPLPDDMKEFLELEGLDAG